VNGYTIAGKTGTAAKLIGGRYSNADYFASFVGFLPSRNPVAAIIVVIDSPHAHGYYGGPIAGPVFQRIAEATLRHFGVAPTLDAPPPVLVARRDDRSGFQPVRAALVSLATSGDTGSMRDLPDLRGLSAREALKVLTKLGLTGRITGNGSVMAQRPVAGTPVEPGTTTELWLARP